MIQHDIVIIGRSQQYSAIAVVDWQRQQRQRKAAQRIF